MREREREGGVLREERQRRGLSILTGGGEPKKEKESPGGRKGSIERAKLGPPS